MARLNRDEFFARIQQRIGDDASEDAISFLEDMTDTYNGLEQQASGDGIDWEKKYRDNDKAWAAKYRNRFFSGDNRTSGCAGAESEEDEGYNADNVTVESLFN